MKPIKFRTLILIFCLLMLAVGISVIAWYKQDEVGVPYVSEIMTWPQGQMKENDANTSKYIVDKYDLSFSFKNGYITESDIAGMCDSEGRPSAASSYWISKGSLAPVTFNEEYITLEGYGEKVNAGLIFAGSFTTPTKCELKFPLAYLEVYKKDPLFKDLDTYINDEVKQDLKSQDENKSWYVEEKLVLTVNGALTPVKRTISTSARKSTNDTYYFEDENYLFRLRTDYSGDILEWSPQELAKGQHAKEEYKQYQLIQQFVQSFAILEE